MESEAQQSPSQCSRALELFLYFFKIGFYTFGGGWSIVAQIQQEYVQSKGWIGNVSYLFGYHVAGFPGALACLLGISLPSLIVLTVVTWCYTQVKDNLYVSRAMTGVRAAVAPVVASAALKLRKAALADRAGYVFLLLAFALYLFGGLSCILIVLISGFLGWLLSVWHCRKGGRS